MADEEDAVEEDVEAIDEEGQDSESEDKKKSGKLLLILIVVTVLLIGGFAALFFTGVLDGLFGGGDDQHTEQVEDGHGDDSHGGGDSHGAAKDSHGAAKDSHGAAKDSHGGDGHGAVATGPQFMEIPDIIVNLNSSSGKTRFLKLKVQVEVENGADLEKVQAVAPRVVDHFQTYLRELRVEDLKGSAGIYRLRQELVRRVNAAAYPVKVSDVLFQEILIQ